MRTSLRVKLYGGLLATVVSSGIIASVAGTHLIQQAIMAQAEEKARSDLNAAQVIYDEALTDVRESVRHTAARFFLREAVAVGRVAECAGPLAQTRQDENLDFLTVADHQGQPLLRRGGTSGAPLRSLLLRQVLAGGAPLAGTAVLTVGDLEAEGVELPPGTVTPDARPAAGGAGAGAPAVLVLLAAAPLSDAGGGVVGVVYGGRVLNGESQLVDKIEQTIHRAETYQGRYLGNATVFQGPVRVATTLRDDDGRRQVGTEIDPRVYRQLLAHGGRYVGIAKVITDPDVAAYMPILDSDGKQLGVIGVGMLAERFTAIKRHVLVTFFAITAVAVLLAALICYLVARAVMRPVNALTRAARRLSAGDLAQPVELGDSPAEIALLVQAFNRMIVSIQERDALLRQQTQEQIMKSDKLAMIGRLSAGVAHEINNPLGSILLFTRLLLRRAAGESQEKDNLERIEKETRRCQNIVRDLLDFARQRPPKVERVEINGLVAGTLRLLENQPLFHNLELVKELAADLPPVAADPGQLQQVFVNIILNAVDAMNSEGRLTIATRAVAGGTVEVAFTDTGCGIPPEHLERVFEPFFTTKSVGRGTGLGLSVSYGIVERHGGTIRVQSEVGLGSTFTVVLRTAEAGS